MWIIVAIAVTSMATVTIIATVITATNSPRVIVITNAAGCLDLYPYVITTVTNYIDWKS